MKREFSQITYDRNSSGADVAQSIFLADARFFNERCSGAPTRVLRVSYPKGLYFSARDARICVADSLHDGFVSSASHASGLKNFVV